jgi:hypothetical protein
MLLVVAGAANAQTQDGVGDVDSFGRASIYLGAKQSEYFGMSGSCTPPLFPVPSLCRVTPSPMAPLNVTVPNLVRINLPARVANSQVCFEFTPQINVTHQNQGATPVRSNLTTYARVRFRSPVLTDPTIVNPATGLPWPNAEIGVAPMFALDARYLPPSAVEFGFSEFTRRCSTHVMSKQRLVAEFGLTREQADLFFNQPITVFVDGVYTAEHLTNLRMRYHVALFGDKR